MRELQVYLELLQKEGLAVKSRLYGRKKEPVRKLSYKSKEAEPGTLFICKGAAFRREYLEEAAAGGAVCYVSERDYGIGRVPYILVTDVRAAMAVLAKEFYRIPDGALRCVGITGTKGKTTTACYIKGIFDEYRRRAGQPEIACLTSVGMYDGKAWEKAELTTPEAPELYRHFRNAWRGRSGYLVMEVSSQALKYQRVRGVRFDTGIFLNISEDHISPEEHENFEDYFASKLRMFRQTDTAVVNLDSPESERVLEAASAARRVLTFGTSPQADICGHDIWLKDGKICFSVSCDRFEQDFELAMHGVFNVENALAAIAAAYLEGIPPEDMREGLRRVTVSGRMEEFSGRGGKVRAIVDYAHNALSFRKIFDAVRMEYPGYDLISVFGCPGGKALNRRRELGLIAGRNCRKIYLSTDDPGPERTGDIMKKVGYYVQKTGCPYECIPDREEAIRKALEEAEDYTVVLVLGKGNETTQRIGRFRQLCRADSEIVRECLKQSANAV